MGVALVSDLSDLSDLSDNFGAPLYTPWVCRALFGMARGQIYRRGMRGFFDGNGGMRVAVVWRLHKTYKTYKTIH